MDDDYFFEDSLFRRNPGRHHCVSYAVTCLLSSHLLYLWMPSASIVFHSAASSSMKSTRSAFSVCSLTIMTPLHSLVPPWRLFCFDPSSFLFLLYFGFFVLSCSHLLSPSTYPRIEPWRCLASVLVILPSSYRICLCLWPCLDYLIKRL